MAAEAAPPRHSEKATEKVQIALIKIQYMEKYI